MKSLVVYITAGFPNSEVFEKFISLIENAGANFIEIGIPPRYAKYDGPAIRRSYDYVKNLGVDVWSSLRTARRLTSIPIIALTYLEDYVDRFEYLVERLQDVEVDSVLFPDLLIDYVDSYEEVLDAVKSMGMEITLFVTPTVPDRFIERVSPLSKYFLYYGIRPTTGIQIPIKPLVLVKRVRNLVRNSLIVGFGLSESDIVEVVEAGADGVAIGTAVVEALTSGGIDAAIGVVRGVRGLLDGVQ